MPEGPQVFRIAEKLRETLTNAILETFILYPGSATSSSEDLTSSSEDLERSGRVKRSIVINDLHARVVRVITKGKRAVIVLDDGRGILLTFALGGSLSFDYGHEAPQTSTAISVMSFLASASGTRWTGDKQVHVTLEDPQHLASAIFDRMSRIVTGMLATGFDPLHTIAGMREWLTLCELHSGRLVATFITDQKIVAGVGNRYRSEIMHVADVPPDARLKDLNEPRLQILLITIYRVLKMASRDEYVFSVYGLKKSMKGLPIIRAEVAKGVFVWTTAKTVVSARRKKLADTVDDQE